MTVSIKKIILWQVETENRAGALAERLRPLADAGIDLAIVMGYRYPGQPDRAAIEVAPISGKKAAAAASKAGLTLSEIPCLQVEGDDRPGLGYAIANQLAAAGINLAFLIAQVIGKKHTALFGFESAADAAKATGLIRSAAKPAKKKK